MRRSPVVPSRAVIGRRIGAGFVAAVALVGAPSAPAATFCVGDAACPTAAQLPTLEAAALATGASPGLDVVRVGPGAREGAAFEAGNPVEMVGAGQGVTRITAAPGRQAALALADPQSTVRGLSVEAADATGAVGLRLAAVAEDVAVVARAGATARATGVLLLDGAVLRASAISVVPVADALGADVVAGADAMIERTTVVGAGLRVRGARLVVARSRVDVQTGVALLAASGGAARADSSLLRALPGAEGGVRAHQPASGAGAAAVRLRHVTLVGSGRVDSPALAATASGDAAFATVRADDSVVRGFAGDRLARAEAGADALVEVSHSNFDPATDRATGAGRLSPFAEGDNRTYGSIRFVDSAGGDYRLRADSPVIDRGTPGALLPDEPVLDLDGLPRIVDGNGVAGATRDMGAYEYQRRAPVLTATATPSATQVGAPIRFEAAVSDPDPGDAVAIRWVFDDGTAADGPVAVHAFGTPGAHSATVTATDSASMETVRVVLVRTVPPAPPIAGVGVPAPPDIVAPRLALPDRRLRVSRTGRVPIRIRCAAGEPETCRGRLSLSAVRGGKRKRRVTLAVASFHVPAGAQRTVRPRLRAAGRRLLRRTRSIRVRLTVDARDAAGNRRLVQRQLTLWRAGNAKRGSSR